jgi:hypothetical protein
MVATILLYLSALFGAGLIGWYTYDTKSEPDDLIRAGATPRWDALGTAPPLDTYTYAMLP